MLTISPRHVRFGREFPFGLDLTKLDNLEIVELLDSLENVENLVG